MENDFDVIFFSAYTSNYVNDVCYHDSSFVDGSILHRCEIEIVEVRNKQECEGEGYL